MSRNHLRTRSQRWERGTEHDESLDCVLPWLASFASRWQAWQLLPPPTSIYFEIYSLKERVVHHHHQWPSLIGNRAKCGVKYHHHHHHHTITSEGDASKRNSLSLSLPSNYPSYRSCVVLLCLFSEKGIVALGPLCLHDYSLSHKLRQPQVDCCHWTCVLCVLCVLCVFEHQSLPPWQLTASAVAASIVAAAAAIAQRDLTSHGNNEGKCLSHAQRFVLCRVCD